MKYCKKCGLELEDNVLYCPECGTQQDGPAAPQVVDNGGFGWGLLGFCIPIVGLILFLCWKDTKPKTSKAAGKGALVSVIVVAVIYVLLILLGVGAAFMLN